MQDVFTPLEIRTCPWTSPGVRSGKRRKAMMPFRRGVSRACMKHVVNRCTLYSGPSPWQVFCGKGSAWW
eukprot:9671106-Prorocentrum_lima.AAC.1